MDSVKLVKIGVLSLNREPAFLADTSKRVSGNRSLSTSFTLCDCLGSNTFCDATRAVGESDSIANHCPY